jgi:hypothetical protein
MAKGAIFIGWGEPFPTYREKALKVFSEAMQFNKRLQQQGEIDSFEPVILDYHGGDLSGFTLLRGDRDKLSRLRTNPEFMSLIVKCALVVKDIGVIDAFNGDAAEARLADYQKQMSNVG